MSEQEIMFKATLIWLFLLTVSGAITAIHWRFTTAWSWYGFKQYSWTWAVFISILGLGGLIIGSYYFIELIRYIFYL